MDKQAEQLLYGFLASLGIGAVIYAVVKAKSSGASMLPGGMSSSPPLIYDQAVSGQRVFGPHSAEATALFTQAAAQAGVPSSWATDSNLHDLLAAESGGWVGRPNYHFGDLANLNNVARWPEVWAAIRNGTWQNLILPQYKSAPSSATGLGQMTSTNLKTGKYYPSSLNGIGNANEEAVGMLKYIKERYTTPAEAWTFHKAKHWY